MLEIHKDTTIDGALVLHLSGTATVEQADALRQALLDALQQSEQEQKALRINCVQVKDVDSFILQMICSAHRSSISRKVLMTWDGQPSPPVMGRIREAGFVRHVGCSRCPTEQHCMWCEK